MSNNNDSIQIKFPMFSSSYLTVFRLLILFILGFANLTFGLNTASAGQEIYSIFGVKAISDDKILPSTSFKNAKEVDKLRVVAALGEYEPISFVVTAHQDVIGLKPVPTNLRSDNGTISSGNVDIRLVKCWYQGCEDSIHYKHCPGGAGRYLVPELLLKDDRLLKVDRVEKVNWLRVNLSGAETYIDITSTENSESKRDDDRSIPPSATFDDAKDLRAVNIRGDQNQQYWITIYVPPESPSGLYLGKIVLKSDNAPNREIAIEVNVLPFKLEPPMLEYSIYYKGRIAKESANLKHVSTNLKTESQLREDMKNMHRHGIVSMTTTQTYKTSDDLFERFLKARNEAGMNSKLYVLWASTYFEHEILAKSLMNFARSLGFDEVYFYGGEELSEKGWAQRVPLWKAMRSIGGKVFVAKSAPEIAEFIDVAVGGIRKLTRANAVERARVYHGYGNRIFARSNPQVGIENSEVYRRNYGMLLMGLEYDGVMNYAYQDSWGSAWNDFDGYFRDHMFTYPTSNGVIDTIQWEGFREGVDDVKYLTTLINVVRDAKSTGANVEKVEKVERWIRSIDYANADLDEVRAEIVRNILTLRRVSSPTNPRVRVVE